MIAGQLVLTKHKYFSMRGPWEEWTWHYLPDGMIGAAFKGLHVYKNEKGCRKAARTYIRRMGLRVWKVKKI